MEDNKDKFSGLKAHTDMIKDSDLLEPVWDLKIKQNAPNQAGAKPAETNSQATAEEKKPTLNAAVNPQQKQNNPTPPPQQQLAQQIQKTNQAMNQLTELARRMTDTMGDFVSEFKSLNKGNAFSNDSLKRLQSSIDNAVVDGNRYFMIITCLLISALTLMGWYLVKNKPVDQASLTKVEISGLNELHNTLINNHNEVLKAVNKVSTDQNQQTQVVDLKLNNFVKELDTQIDKKLTNTRVKTIYKTCIKHRHKKHLRWHTHCW